MPPTAWKKQVHINLENIIFLCSLKATWGRLDKPIYMTMKALYFKEAHYVHQTHQLGSLVVRVFTPYLGGTGSPTESNQRFQIGSLVKRSTYKLRVVQRKNWLTCCQNNVTGRYIIQLMCLRCDISVRQHYKVVIIPSVKSRHRPDMTWKWR